MLFISICVIFEWALGHLECMKNCFKQNNFFFFKAKNAMQDIHL